MLNWLCCTNSSWQKSHLHTFCCHTTKAWFPCQCVLAKKAWHDVSRCGHVCRVCVLWVLILWSAFSVGWIRARLQSMLRIRLLWVRIHSGLNQVPFEFCSQFILRSTGSRQLLYRNRSVIRDTCKSMERESLKISNFCCCFTEEHCCTFSVFFRAWVRSVQQPDPRHASPGHHSSVRYWGQWRVRVQQHSKHCGGGTRVWNPGGWFSNDWPSSYIILLLHVKCRTENLWPYDDLCSGLLWVWKWSEAGVIFGSLFQAWNIL